MRLTDLLKKKSIRKVVDPTLSAEILPPTVRPEERTPVTQVPPITSQQLVVDLKEAVRSASDEVTRVMAVVAEANAGSPEFSEYKRLVDEAELKVGEVIEQGRVPGSITEYVRLMRAEQRVLRNVNDPRAPLYRLMSIMRQELDIMRYGVTRLWERFVGETSLYTEFETSNVIRMSLYKDIQRARLVKTTARRIESLRLGDLIERCLLEALAVRLRGAVTSVDVSEVVSELTRLRRLFSQVRMLLMLALVAATGRDWFNIFKTINHLIQNLQRRVARRVLDDYGYMVLGGLSRSAIDVINDVADVLGHPCSGLEDLRSMVEGVVLDYLRKIESDIISKEVWYYEVNTTMKNLTDQAVKVGKIKQMISVLDTVIGIIASLEAVALNVDEIRLVSVERIIEQIRSAVDAYAGKLTFPWDEKIRVSAKGSSGGSGSRGEGRGGSE